MKNDTRRSVNESRLLDLKSVCNHPAGTQGCVCARCPHAWFMCEGDVCVCVLGGASVMRGVFALPPVLVSPTGIPLLPAAAGLCIYCMYMKERCPWTRMEITRYNPAVAASFDKHDSQLTRWTV